MGVSLWKSDGTTAGTSIFKVMATARDLMAGPGGAIYFAGSDVPNEWDLWKTDGTPTGTVRVKDIGPGFFGDSIHTMAYVGGVLYISGDDSEGTYNPDNAELWRSDGTEAGTVKVKEIVPGPVGSYPFAFHLLGGRVVFSTRYGTRPAPELWTTDGTADGTVMLKNLNLNTEPAIEGGETPVASGGQFFFVASAGDERDRALWKSDGTAAGTVLVKDISDAVPRTGEDNARQIGNLTDLGGTLLFFAGDLATGRELWRSDGTPEGTVLVKDINPGPAAGVRLGSLAARVGDTLYFTAEDGVHGRELWKSDGTAEGTMMVADATPGPAGSTFVGLSPVGDRLFVPIYIGADSTIELWASDGTAAGTALVRRIGGPRSSNSFPIFDFQGKAYFAHVDSTTGLELWASDGTAAGTGLLKDLLPGGADSHSAPADFTRLGQHFYFTTAYGAERFWRSDGTAAGTVPVDIGVSGVVPRFAHNGLLYLTARVFESQQGLWVTDGTPAGTTQLIPRFAAASFSAFAGKVYVGGYVPGGPAQGAELWETDGTPAGTRPVAEIYPGPTFSGPTPLAVSGDVAVFVATDRRHGRELWRLNVQSPATVVGRHLFYGGSATKTNPSPDIATDKAPLLPGGAAASFRNVSSYARGINGLIVDVRGLPQGAGLSAADFDFHVGTAAAWRPAPAPSAITVERNAGARGSDRITLTWPDGAIRNTWLRVTLKPTPATGLPAPDVFYFGTLPGETGDAAAPTVTARDLALTRLRVGSQNPAHRTRHDFDRDGVISARDVLIVRNNQRRALPLFTPAAAPSPAPAARTARTPPPPRRSFFTPPDETPALLA